jgi:hypothetical protein
LGSRSTSSAVESRVGVKTESDLKEESRGDSQPPQPGLNSAKERRLEVECLRAAKTLGEVGLHLPQLFRREGAVEIVVEMPKRLAAGKLRIRCHKLATPCGEERFRGEGYWLGP